MTLKPWKKIKEKIVSKNPWWEYRLATFEIPSGKQIEYHYMHGSHAVLMIAVDDEGNIPLVRQYRALYDSMSLEFPMGGIDNGNTPEEGVVEEFAQEAGLRAGKVEFIGKFQPTNARLDDWCYVYVGSQLSTVEMEPDETEEFEHERLSFDEVDRQMLNGEIEDGMCIAAWFLARKRVRELRDSI